MNDCPPLEIEPEPEEKVETPDWEEPIEEEIYK